MPLRDGQSQIDTIALQLPDSGIEIRSWSEYSFTQSFLIPTASWSFTVPATSDLRGSSSSFDDPEAAALAANATPEKRKSLGSEFDLGSKVQIRLNDQVQCTGFIERVTASTSSNGGAVFTLKGRDILGPVVDACIDPAFKFSAGMPLEAVLKGVLEPFGIDTIYSDDDLNIAATTGRAKKTTAQTTRGSRRPRKKLKDTKVQQLKPRFGEGVFSFLSRILSRFNLMIWAHADGSGVVVSKPEFDFDAAHFIYHFANDVAHRNNVLSASLERDLISQPSVIVGFGKGGGQTTDKSRNVVIMVNELVGYEIDNSLSFSHKLDQVPKPSVKTIINGYKGARILPRREEFDFLEFVAPKFRPAPMFVRDDESADMEQLESYVRFQMAMKQQKSLVATYELVGHTYGAHPWAMNTMVDVTDDVLGIYEALWVLEKTFKKSSGSGTTTTLKLIRPYTMELG